MASLNVPVAGIETNQVRGWEYENQQALFSLGQASEEQDWQQI